MQRDMSGRQRPLSEDRPGSPKGNKRSVAPAGELEFSETLVTEMVAVVSRIVRDHQPPGMVTSAQTAMMVREVLASLAEEADKHDTRLRLSSARLAGWLNRVRCGLRQ
jgi:hypothetical protein